MATEIEAQTVRWIAELIGYPVDCGGVLVSGGNMANIVWVPGGAPCEGAWDVRVARDARAPAPLRVYASAETHTWMQKAADISGSARTAIRWIPTDGEQRMDLAALDAAIDADRAAGELPFLVVGTAGSVSTGAVDPLPEHRRALPRADLWFHVDGAYGGFAAAVPGRAGRPPCALREADSIAVDPHKWLYAPLEAGCVLVRDRGRAARHVLLPPALLPFRRRGRADQLLRVRAAELARLPGAEGLARPAPGGPRRATRG